MPFFRRPAHAAAAGDPIPFAHDGRLHLFYLSSPEGPLDYPGRVRTTWQHAVSDDLLSWRELPPAVAPGEPGSYDAGGIWTGSVVEHAGTFYLFYTAHDPGAANPQTICLATSTDLVEFERHPGNPLLLPAPGCEAVDWRDPYVFFNREEGRWWMLIAARRADGPRWSRGCIMLAVSDDLLTWQVEPEPFYAPGDTFCPECPELWEYDGRWYLVFSRFSERVGTIVRVGDTSRGPFRVPIREELGGRRWYAAKSAPWGEERAFFGWVHDVVDDQGAGRRRWLWGGDFALPRLVRPEQTVDGIVLRVRSAVEVPSGEVVGCLDERELGNAGGHQEAAVVADVPHRAVVDASFTTGDVSSVGLDLARGDGDEVLRLEVDLRRSETRLSVEPQPLDDFWADLTGSATRYREVDGPVLAFARLYGATGAPVRLRVVLDHDLLEAYVNDDVVLTQRIERVAEESIHVFALDGTTTVSATVARLG